MNKHYLLFLAIVFNASASIVLRLASNVDSCDSKFLLSYKSLILNLCALLFYAMAFVAYYYILKVIPVGKAYLTITAGAQVVIICMATFILGDRYGSNTWIGMVLVLFGLYIISVE